MSPLSTPHSGRRGVRHFRRHSEQKNYGVRLAPRRSPMEKPKLKENDAMTCRSCGNEERASEGYPCADCGTFLCLICSFRGVTRCKACEEKAKAQSSA